MAFDYKKIGLKAGLEIHQQLDTAKLFCSCPSLLRSDEPSQVIHRRLNPVVGQTGVIDAAAKHEQSKDKLFAYQVFDTNCLVETDGQPPRPINQEALNVALQISLLLNCKILPVTQVMRKTVIDGSNTSGFQRTALIAYDGFVETSAGKIPIDTVMIEEDSARKVSDEANIATFKLDRLGIPLVEIATGPHLHTPEAIKEAALKLGEILRACNVKRGIGTIRQDVNISIAGSKRVEIKGFQDPKMMITTIDKEIERQQECVKEKNCESQVRNALPDGSTEFLRPMPGSARMYPETDVPLLRIPKALIDELKKNLPKLASEHKSYLDDFGLNDQLVKLILKENLMEEFKVLLNVCSDYDLVAKSLTLFPKELAKKSGKKLADVKEILNTDALEAVLEKVGKTIEKSDVKLVLQKLIDGKTLTQALEKSDIDLESEVKILMKEKPGLSQGAYMGLIMNKHKGQVSGKEVSDVLRKFL